MRLFKEFHSRPVRIEPAPTTDTPGEIIATFSFVAITFASNGIIELSQGSLGNGAILFAIGVAFATAAMKVAKDLFAKPSLPSRTTNNQVDIRPPTQ